ncbi:MAG: aminotransferase class III-fold pyridoxal phosphate-dependent enzyme [Proteobacteria bacterium]|nr:aminotransferase class III-fold pyridoxal phosphate-dependent enzyme [Pseudomonadota bacterium]
MSFLPRAHKPLRDILFNKLRNDYEKGIGLLGDRETKEPAADEVKELVKRCYEKGLIILSYGVYHNVIRSLIPLVISDDQLERGFSILEQSLRECQKT